MKRATLSPVLLLLVLLPACGNDPYEFQTLAFEPTGEPIDLAYHLAPGQRFVIQVETEQSMAVGEGKSMPLGKREMRSAYTCREALPDGSFRMDFEIDLEGLLGHDLVAEVSAELGEDLLAPLTGSFILGPRGAVSELEFTEEGEDGFPSAMLIGMPGTGTFLRFPEGGLRAGEALELSSFFNEDALRGFLGGMTGGGAALGADMLKFEGELVLLGVREIDGEERAEFALNLAMSFRFDKGRRAKMDFGYLLTGSLFVSTSTGMLAGRSTYEGKGRMETRMEKLEMKMGMGEKGTILATVESD